MTKSKKDLVERSILVVILSVGFGAVLPVGVLYLFGTLLLKDAGPAGIILIFPLMAIGGITWIISTVVLTKFFYKVLLSKYDKNRNHK